MAESPYTKAELQAMLNDADEGSEPQSVGALASAPILVKASDLAELFALKDKIGALEKELAAQRKLAAPAAAGPIECDCKACSAAIIKPGEKGYVSVKDSDGVDVPYMAEGTHAA